ncbi:unnamed protein product [Amoebophrya sp. A25]|nr:unnamed protein product [Amoebophrya sp. A25]|eukprot:GSA25T00011763001.1
MADQVAAEVPAAPAAATELSSADVAAAAAAPSAVEQASDFSVDDFTAGSVVKIFSLPQECVSRIVGNNGEKILQMRAAHGCGIAINQETKDMGYSVCTVRGHTEESVANCKAELDQLMDEAKANASKEVQIPQKYVGMIIGASGITLTKIRKHTGAQIEVVQDTANDGFSVAHVSGTLEQVDKTVDVISKMVVSGRQASEGYQEYLKNVQAGNVPSAPFKPDKMPGLEFLEDDLDGKGTPSHKGKGNNHGHGLHGTAFNHHHHNYGLHGGYGGGHYTPRSKEHKGGHKGGDRGGHDKGGATAEERGGFVGGGIGIKGGSGKNIAFVDASTHDKEDKFEVPQKYVGLLVGKQGEAIRRFRQYAAERNMAIRVNQDNQHEAATVVITGSDLDEITALKADMTQNLFQAIAKLDSNGKDGSTSFTKSGKDGGKKGKGKYNDWGKGGKNYQQNSGSGDWWGGSNRTPEVYYKGPRGSNDGPYGKGGDGGKGWRGKNNSWDSQESGSFGKGGSGDFGGKSNGGNEQQESDWWANVFTQVLQNKNSPQGRPQQDNGWGNWSAQVAQSPKWNANGGANGGISDGDLGSALAALLGSNGSSNGGGMGNGW